MALVQNIVLLRPNELVPWGFRLQGGADFRYPLSVKRVIPGTIASQFLSEGDVLLALQGHDARKLCHFEACEKIKNAGKSIDLTVRKANFGHLCDENYEEQQRLENKLIEEKEKQERDKKEKRESMSRSIEEAHCSSSRSSSRQSTPHRILSPSNDYNSHKYQPKFYQMSPEQCFSPQSELHQSKQVICSPTLMHSSELPTKLTPIATAKIVANERNFSPSKTFSPQQLSAKLHQLQQQECILNLRNSENNSETFSPSHHHSRLEMKSAPKQQQFTKEHSSGYEYHRNLYDTRRSASFIANNHKINDYRGFEMYEINNEKSLQKCPARLSRGKSEPALGPSDFQHILEAEDAKRKQLQKMIQEKLQLEELMMIAKRREAEGIKRQAEGYSSKTNEYSKKEFTPFFGKRTQRARSEAKTTNESTKIYRSSSLLFDNEKKDLYSERSQNLVMNKEDRYRRESEKQREILRMQIEFKKDQEKIQEEMKKIEMKKRMQMEIEQQNKKEEMIKLTNEAKRLLEIKIRTEEEMLLKKYERLRAEAKQKATNEKNKRTEEALYQMGRHTVELPDAPWRKQRHEDPHAPWRKAKTREVRSEEKTFSDELKEMKRQEEEAMKEEIRRYRYSQSCDSDESDDDEDERDNYRHQETFRELHATSEEELFEAQEKSIRNLERQIQKQRKEEELRKRTKRAYSEGRDVPKGRYDIRGRTVLPVTKFSPDPMEFGFRPIQKPPKIMSRSTGFLASKDIDSRSDDEWVDSMAVAGSLVDIRQLNSKPPLPSSSSAVKGKGYRLMRTASNEELIHCSDRSYFDDTERLPVHGMCYSEASSFKDLGGSEDDDFKRLLMEYYSAYYAAYYSNYFRKQQMEGKTGGVATGNSNMNSLGGPPPPPPPPPFPNSVPASRLPNEPSPKSCGKPPAALAGAMLQDKKPFTYTPGGLNLSEIRSPRIQRRLARNAVCEGVSPSSAPSTSPSPHPVSPLFTGAKAVQVLPVPGIGMTTVAPPQMKEAPERSVCGPPPPPPPFSLSSGYNYVPSPVITYPSYPIPEMASEPGPSLALSSPVPNDESYVSKATSHIFDETKEPAPPSNVRTGLQLPSLVNVALQLPVIEEILPSVSNNSSKQNFNGDFNHISSPENEIIEMPKHPVMQDEIVALPPQISTLEDQLCFSDKISGTDETYSCDDPSNSTSHILLPPSDDGPSLSAETKETVKYEEANILSSENCLPINNSNEIEKSVPCPNEDMLTSKKQESSNILKLEESCLQSNIPEISDKKLVEFNKQQSQTLSYNQNSSCSRWGNQNNNSPSHVLSEEKSIQPVHAVSVAEKLRTVSSPPPPPRIFIRQSSLPAQPSSYSQGTRPIEHSLNRSPNISPTTGLQKAPLPWMCGLRRRVASPPPEFLTQRTIKFSPRKTLTPRVAQPSVMNQPNVYLPGPVMMGKDYSQPEPQVQLPKNKVTSQVKDKKCTHPQIEQPRQRICPSLVSEKENVKPLFEATKPRERIIPILIEGESPTPPSTSSGYGSTVASPPVAPTTNPEVAPSYYPYPQSSWFAPLSGGLSSSPAAAHVTNNAALEALQLMQKNLAQLNSGLQNAFPKLLQQKMTDTLLSPSTLFRAPIARPSENGRVAQVPPGCAFTTVGGTKVHIGVNDPSFPAQSKSFRVLQSVYSDPNENAESTSSTQNNASPNEHVHQHTTTMNVPIGRFEESVTHPSRETAEREPRKYTGGNIPSRSFRMLQAMTATDQDDDDHLVQQPPSPTNALKDKHDKENSYQATRYSPPNVLRQTSPVLLTSNHERHVNSALSRIRGPPSPKPWHNSWAKDSIVKSHENANKQNYNMTYEDSGIPSGVFHQLQGDFSQTDAASGNSSSSFFPNIRARTPESDAKKSALKELAGHFDSNHSSLKKPTSAPGRIFRTLQRQYDVQNQNKSNFKANNSTKPVGKHITTTNIFIDGKDGSKQDQLSYEFKRINLNCDSEIKEKPYNDMGVRIPGRTFRLLTENIETHPSIFEARK